MNKYNTKEAIFKAWDELIFLLEYLETITEHKEIIREIKETQLLLGNGSLKTSANIIPVDDTPYGL